MTGPSHTHRTFEPLYGILPIFEASLLRFIGSRSLVSSEREPMNQEKVLR
jgi:hypothetical protein